jgi:TolB-like protein
METFKTVDGVEAAQELERILGSSTFSKAQRSQRFLRYLVEAALSANPTAVKEYTVAIDVFDRGVEYDPAVDATVRVEAGRLRNRLREYYAQESSVGNMVIVIPKGRYAAVFCRKLAKEQSESRDFVAGDDSPSVGLDASTNHTSSLPAPLVDHERAEQLERVDDRRRLRRAIFLSLCIALVLTILTWGIWKSLHHAGSSIHSMVVLPLKNLSGAPDQDYFAEGMTDELNTQLARIPNLRVVSRDSVMQENAERKPLRQIEDELHVDAVVEGSIVRSGDRVRINAQLIDTRSQSHIWGSSFEGSSNDILSLQDNVAREIALHAKLVFSPTTLSVNGGTGNPSADAYDAYLRGRYFFDRRDARQSAFYFEQAIASDPDFAASYAGLANAIGAEITLELISPAEGTPRALAAARHAVALDPNQGEGYTALGSIELDETWDWRSAEQHLLRGIELSPSDSLPHVMYAYYLDAMNRPEEAVAQTRLAAAMDPLSFFVVRSLGSSLYYARDYDKALEQLQRARNMQPQRSRLIDNWISWSYQMKGMHDEAIRYDLKLLETTESGVDAVRLSKLYQQNGWKPYWKLRAALPPGLKDWSCQSYDQGVKMVRAEMIDEALAAFDTAVDQRCFWMAQINVDPLFDTLRKDPRFPSLAIRVGLPIIETIGSKGKP